MLHMEIIHQSKQMKFLTVTHTHTRTHTKPWIYDGTTPRCMRAITVALPTNKQNHNAETHEQGGSAVVM